MAAPTNQTNNTVDIFYTDTWQAAWQPLGRITFNAAGAVVVPNKTALLARMEIFNHFFMPHPFNNLYHDEMLDLETRAEHWKVEHHMLKADYKKRRRIWFVFSFTIGVVSGVTIATVPILLSK